MAKKILITGATSGFGEAMAKRFAMDDNELWLIGRRVERLNKLKEALEKQACKVWITALDVQDKMKVLEFGKTVEKELQGLDVLINNAGLALGTDGYDQGDLQDWDTMIDTNVKGLLYVTRALVPLMLKQKKGHIINMGSTAGKMVYQGGNVYCATKFAVDALTQTMRIDFLPYHIKVTSINPGMAETEFSKVRYKGDEEKAAAVYEGFKTLKAEDVAEVVYYTTTLPDHVCINDLTLSCTQQANSVYKFKG